MLFTEEEIRRSGTVFERFAEFSKIPHGSGNTAAIADYLVDFANKNLLTAYRDAKNNVLIRKCASPGYERHAPVVLQGHIDMVAECEPGSGIDMTRDGLTLWRDGDFLRAKGTTLGGDDGVAVAYMLSILEDKSLVHPTIEALFTSDEEIGLIGAGAFDTSLLSGKTLINIDSDDEGVFTVGCAGGVRVDLDLPLPRTAETATGYKVTLTGLLGGHSGAEIDKGHANAILMLGRLLSSVPGVRVAAFVGGNADNAIPRETVATILCPADPTGALLAALDRERTTYPVETEMNVKVESVEVTRPLSRDTTDKFLAFLGEIPYGVQAMSREIPGLVETSLNPGIALLGDASFSLSLSVRSSVEKEKDALVEKLFAITEKYGGTHGTRGAYPAWEYNKDSRLRDLLCSVYEEKYGASPKVLVIHAGLECGIFAGQIDGFDAVSLGPDNFDIHTTNEHLSIPSTIRVYEFLLDVLSKM